MNRNQPSIGIIALGSEKVDVVLELQLEDKVFVDAVLLRGLGYGVAQQG